MGKHGKKWRQPLYPFLSMYYARLLAEEMEQVADLSVPLTAEAHWGGNWLEAKG